MLKEFIETVTDILYPKNCHICSKILKGRINAFDDHLCAECVSSMKRADRLPSILPKTTSGPSSLSAVTTCYSYEGSTRELLHRFKYDHRPYLASSITRLMHSTLRLDIFENIDCLVPIPLHPVRAREREFNQSQLLAEELGRMTTRPVFPALRKIKYTPSQTSFSREKRFTNLKQSFAATDLTFLKNKNILLVDDVITTGATLTEAANTLKNACAGKIFGLAFARG